MNKNSSLVFLALCLAIISCNSNKKASPAGETTDTLNVAGLEMGNLKGLEFPSGLLDSPMIYINNKDTVIYKHKKVIIYGDTFYVVEGDMLLTPAKYYNYRFPVVSWAPEKKMPRQQKLWMPKVNGDWVRWRPGSKITFTITESSFPSTSEYKLVKEGMIKAIAEWNKVCNIKFEYLPQRDHEGLYSPIAGVNFVVVGTNVGGAWYAFSFFPDDDSTKMRLKIDRSYFTAEWDQVGILRHELGHILGFLHEQNRCEAPKICNKDIVSGAFPVTDYDPGSVMHYPCGGKGSNELPITATDVLGAREVYPFPKN